MPLPRQTPYREILRKLHALGFEGPAPGAGWHEAGPYTFREHPNSRTVELSNDFRGRLLRQWEITDEEWEDA